MLGLGKFQKKRRKTKGKQTEVCKAELIIDHVSEASLSDVGLKSKNCLIFIGGHNYYLAIAVILYRPPEIPVDDHD